MNFDIQFTIDSFFEIVQWAPITLGITLFSFVASFIIAIVVALIRIYRIKAIAYFCDFYVSFIRGTPLILHIFLVLYGLPRLFDFLAATIHFPLDGKSLSTLTFLLIALSINGGAYLSEVVRSGILAVDKGEIEAAQSIGMTQVQVMRRVIIPQALVVCLPLICNSFIGMLQGSSLAYFIGVREMTVTSYMLGGNYWKYFEAFVAAALVYWIIAIIIEQSMLFLERLLNKRHQNLKETAKIQTTTAEMVEI